MSKFVAFYLGTARISLQSLKLTWRIHIATLILENMHWYTWATVSESLAQENFGLQKHSRLKFLQGRYCVPHSCRKFEKSAFIHTSNT